ncbi:THUMP domain-containing protein [Vogesella sp. LIG4]|uniref:THUMP domain-containing protein n=1 Tax=Vogesella sp. LIG4 TaxID=1192162 RepID=UPI00081F784C|nr:THUMP domain-containing protein [Vogesella sp. LIG4]SCK08050.1 putative N6-adenine-specific DNA methylase [Vogesella sp. LIG4]
MSTFRSRQRASLRRQPTTPAERNTPAAGQQPPAGQAQGKPRFGNPERREGGFKREGEFQPRGDRQFDKPRFGGNEQRREGGFKREGEFQPRGDRQFDKPRFGGDKPREGGFKREGEFQPRGERQFDKPRFGGDKPREGGFKREGEFQPRGDRQFDKPRFGGDKPREGGFKREGEFQPRGDRQFDKPRFGGDKPREGGFKREGEFQPRGDRQFDKPRYGNEHREGGFKREGEFQPRGERQFDKPRYGNEHREGGFKREGEFQPRGERQFDKPRFGGNEQRREGGFKREGEFQPRGDRQFDKPRFGGNEQRREGGFKREGEFQPRGDRQFDKPRFGGNEQRREGEFQPRGEREHGQHRQHDHHEGGFRRNDGLKREGSQHHRHEFQPRGDHAIEKPRTLFGGKTPAANPQPAAEDAPQEKRYTRDRVAGRGGKAHPDYVAPPPRPEQEDAPAAAAPQAPRTSFLKRVNDEQSDAPREQAPRSFDQPRHGAGDKPRFGGERREGEFQPRGERNFDKPRFGGERREGEFQPRGERSFDKPRFGGERREGEFQPRGERSFDKPRFGGERREGEFQPRGERSFDKPRFGGERREGEFQPRGERSFDKPRFGNNERREGGFRRDDEVQPRTLFGKGQQESGERGERSDKVGRTAFVKTQFRALQENELALFASCPRGLEKILADEITQQGGSELQLTDGGIAFIGSREVMMRVNLHSRVASRLLMQLSQGSFREERDIYELARAIDWPALFAVSCTIKVNTDGHARLRSMDYVSLLVKDAICDRFREAGGERPSVDTRHPDMRIRVFISGFDVQIYLDTSGEALFKRGWREETGEAPLRENLAAGILLLSGYNGSQPLLDPMCGSGTFLVEAADIALNRAPGRERHFAFEQLHGHNDILWHSIRNDAVLAQRKLAALPLYGNDRDPELVAIARRNLARADIEPLVTLSCGDATELAAPADSGLIVCNPPYGVRLDEQDALAELYPLLATWLKRNFAGWYAHFMTADTRLPSLMRLSTSSRPPLFNGPLACHVYGFELVAGSNRKEKPADDSQSSDSQ